MTSKMAKRVEALREDPEVMAWVQEFQELAGRMPKGKVMVFVAGSTPCVLALDEKGQSFDCGHGYDSKSTVASVRGGIWDGGDF